MIFGDRVLVADGATGTNYQEMGLEPGVAPEEWVFDAPDRVQELHRRFEGPLRLTRARNLTRRWDSPCAASLRS